MSTAPRGDHGAAIAEEIREEATRVAYGNIRKTAVAGMVIAAVVGAFFWDRVPGPDLGLWLSLTLASSALRLWLSFHFRRLDPVTAKDPRWGRLLILSGLLGALPWGSAVFFLVSPGVWETEMLVTVMVLGAGTVGLLGMASSLSGYVVYATLTVLPLTLWTMWQGGAQQVLIAAICGIYLTLLFSMAISYNRAFVAWLRLLFERKHLAEDLEVARQEAVAASRAKSEFLATMSHEIRTPLNSVLGMTDLVLRTPLSAEQREYVETAHYGGEILLTLVNDLLDLAKIEAGRLELESIDFELGQLVERLVALMSARAGEKNLILSVELSDDLPRWLRGDPARLRQVLLNLTVNAIKFTEVGGILIQVEPAEPDREDGDGLVNLRFSVIDTGIGVPENQRDRLFQSFRQADASISRRFGGTGLGLSICRRLVTAMRGRIGFETTDGYGSIFWFVVPFARGAGGAGSGSLASRAILAPRVILLVEDVESNRRVAKWLLSHEGHRVIVAETGPAALETLARGGLDLVLMDMHMPGMDGLETTRRIRASPDPAVSRLPILGL
ncbi:MAG: ATP-binding protein, partial [Alphaproteobacteria bacterium]